MKAVDMETVLLCGLIAVVAAFGCVVWFAAMTGTQFGDWNGAVLTGIGCSLAGIFWGILLIFNSNKPSKRG